MYMQGLRNKVDPEHLPLVEKLLQADALARHNAALIPFNLEKYLDDLKNMGPLFRAVLPHITDGKTYGEILNIMEIAKKFMNSNPKGEAGVAQLKLAVQDVYDHLGFYQNM